MRIRAGFGSRLCIFLTFLGCLAALPVPSLAKELVNISPDNFLLLSPGVGCLSLAGQNYLIRISPLELESGQTQARKLSLARISRQFRSARLKYRSLKALYSRASLIARGALRAKLKTAFRAVAKARAMRSFYNQCLSHEFDEVLPTPTGSPTPSAEFTPPAMTPTPIATSTPTLPPQQSCGNGMLGEGETCDCGTDGMCGTPDDLLNGKSCTSLGLNEGTLMCQNGCHAFNIQECGIPSSIIYVDNSLSEACLGKYRVQERDCSGPTSSADAYPGIADAAAIVRPGETIMIRGSETPYLAFDVTFTHSGQPGAPIKVLGYPGDARPVVYGGRFCFVFDTPGQGNYVIQNLVIRNASWASILFAPATLPRVSDVRLEDLELYEHGKSGIRAELYGVERLYIKNLVVHEARDSEGGFDFKVNTIDGSCGGGSRQVIIRDTKSYHHTHTQSSGIIAQESTENFIYINNSAYANGEIGFTSKSGGYNIYLNNSAWDQSKSGFYLGRAYKPEVSIQGCGASNYLLLNNVALTRKLMSGDQGALIAWPDANLWAYNNTLVSLKSSPYFVGAPLNILGGEETTVLAYLKNNLVARASESGAVANIQGLSNGKLTWRGTGNLYSNMPGAGPGFFRDHPENYSLEQLQQLTGSESGSLMGQAQFAFLDPEEDTVMHNLQPLADSDAIERGTPYGLSDPNDYPTTVEVFLSHYSPDQNADHAFADFSILSPAEQAEIRNYIREAYRYDQKGRTRGTIPEAGAFESNAEVYIAGTIPGNEAYVQQLNSLVIQVADNEGGAQPRTGNLNLENTRIAAAWGPQGQNINLASLGRSHSGGGSFGVVTYTGIPNLGDGRYQFAVEARDDSGNLATSTVSVYVDTTPPDVSVVSVILAPRVWAPYWTNFTGSGSDLYGVKYYEWDIDGSEQFAVPAAGWDHSIPFLSEIYSGPGTYLVRLRATDRAGNQAVSEPYSFTIPAS